MIIEKDTVKKKTRSNREEGRVVTVSTGARRSNKKMLGDQTNPVWNGENS